MSKYVRAMLPRVRYTFAGVGLRRRLGARAYRTFLTIVIKQTAPHYAMSAWVARVVHSHGFESREPSSIPRDPASLIERLSKLAANDPALFLERYGGQLTEDECAQHFAGLEDYEVKWHLARL